MITQLFGTNIPDNTPISYYVEACVNNIQENKPNDYAKNSTINEFSADASVETYQATFQNKLPLMAKVDATATPSANKIIVNGKDVEMNVYMINDNNYFMLRDIAGIVKGTADQFNVDFDQNSQEILLLSHTKYDGYISKKDSRNMPKSATISTNAIRKDGVILTGESAPKAYYIQTSKDGGNNYFKLRDIASLFGIEVVWDATTQTVGVYTSDYTGPRILDTENPDSVKNYRDMPDEWYKLKKEFEGYQDSDPDKAFQITLKMRELEKHTVIDPDYVGFHKDYGPRPAFKEPWQKYNGAGKGAWGYVMWNGGALTGGNTLGAWADFKIHSVVIEGFTWRNAWGPVHEGIQEDVAICINNCIVAYDIPDFGPMTKEELIEWWKTRGVEIYKDTSDFYSKRGFEYISMLGNHLLFDSIDVNTEKGYKEFDDLLAELGDDACEAIGSIAWYEQDSLDALRY